MQSKKTNCTIPIGVKALAKMMGFDEVEIRFFPKLDELKGYIKDYNYGVLTKDGLIEKLEDLKNECLEENFDMHAEGIGEIIKAIQYRYC